VTTFLAMIDSFRGVPECHTASRPRSAFHTKGSGAGDSAFRHVRKAPILRSGQPANRTHRPTGFHALPGVTRAPTRSCFETETMRSAPKSAAYTKLNLLNLQHVDFNRGGTPENAYHDPQLALFLVDFFYGACKRIEWSFYDLDLLTH